MNPLVLFCAVALVQLAQAKQTFPTDGNYDCDSYDPFASQRPGHACLANMKIHPDIYDVCKDDTNHTCYIFLQEPPFIILDDIPKFNSSESAFSLQKPFKCGQFENQLLEAGGIRGIAFHLHKLTSSRDDWCMWGGHADHCPFNQLVDFINVKAGQGYRFGISGLLLEMPSRQCVNHPSAPFLDNKMIIIGRRAPQFSGSEGPLHQLIKPFHQGTWAIFAGVLLLFVAVCLAIAVRFHWFRGRSLITAFFIFSGERDQALAHEAALQQGVSAREAVSFATKYGLSMSLFRMALLALVAIFALFYEVAVVNFLFQQHNQTLSKPVRRLSLEQLADFAVLKDSALENVWDATLRSGRYRDWHGRVPWQQTPTATDSIKRVQNGDASFMVTFEVLGKYLLMQHSSCSELTVFETQDVLYQFNGGWLYNSKVSEERRMLVDRELVGLRVKGRTRELVEDALQGHTEECSKSNTLDIGPMIILIPCLIFVIPPLLCSVLVLVLWKKKPQRRNGNETESMGDLEMAMETPPKRNEEASTDSSSDFTINDCSQPRLPKFPTRPYR
ncbi:unnamed protein product [Agarophyton chilense]